MNTKIKLFLLLTFGLILLFTQNSFAAKIPGTDYWDLPTNRDPNCGIFNPPGNFTGTPVGSKEQGGGDNEMCNITSNNIPSWNQISQIGFRLNNIVIPVQFYKKLVESDAINKVLINPGFNLSDWGVSSCNSDGQLRHYHCGNCVKSGNYDNDVNPSQYRVNVGDLSSVLKSPTTYNQIKNALTRSCYRGSISTTKSGNTSFFCGYGSKKTCSGGCGAKDGYPVEAVISSYSALNFPDFWSTPGCNPLISEISFKIKTPSGVDIPLINGEKAIINSTGDSGSYQVFMSSSNPSADCEINGTDAVTKDDFKTKYCPAGTTGANCTSKISNGEISSEGVYTSKNTTQAGVTTGIYKYTLSCSGVEWGKMSAKATTTKQTIRVFVGQVPAEPIINSFTIKKIDGTEFPKDKNGIIEINQNDSFNLCWNVQTENPLITIKALKGGIEEVGVIKIQATTQNPDIRIACIEKTLPRIEIGPWNYELELKNYLWSDPAKNKDLGSKIKNISINAVPIKPVIEKFEILDKFNKATTSVLISEPITLSWKVLNTQNIKIDGNNYNEGFQAGINTTIIDGHSNRILPDENDLSQEFTYTLTADELFFTNQPATKSLKLQRRQPGTPIISKFEFDKSAVTKKESGGSGYVTLMWSTAGSRLININGTGVPFSTSAYPSIGTLKISIDDLSVAPEGLEYSLTACPTSAYNVNCSTSKTTLKIYSSDAFGANLYADDTIIRTGNSTTLRWEVVPNDKIKSYSITSSSDDINLIYENTGSGFGLSGERIVAPTTKTTYTLTIQSFNPVLMPDFSTSITIGATDKDSPVVEFSADKTEVATGEAVVLSWNAQGAEEVSINNNIGIVAKQGTTTVYPKFTTLYVLTAKSTQPGVIPDSEKTVQVKITTPGFDGLEKPDEWVDPTDFKIKYGLASETDPEGLAKSGILDLKVNGLDGPITLAAPASFTLSWNLDKYCLGTGSWLSVKTKAGTENITLKKNGKYTYNLYCPGTGSDSVEITVTGGQGGLLDQLLGKNGDGTDIGSQALPVAEIAVSTDKLIFSTDIRVTKGQEIELFVRADKDVNGDEKISRDQNGGWGSLLSNGGGCLYNTKLTKDLQFDGGVQSPKSPQDCNASLGKFTFNDEPGTYQYGVFKLVQNDGKFSNIAYFTVTVDGPPTINSAPTINFRIDGKEANEQILGTPANYYLTWDVNNASSCLATGSWNGIKPLKGIQNFLKSSKSEPVYTLTCENDLGITAKTIALKIVESPICTITALPPTLNKQSAFITESELSWKCNYADECKLSPSTTDNIKTYGTLRVSPDQTTTYTLTCTNSDISKSFEAKVEVIK